jgi:hypothetical protein
MVTSNAVKARIELVESCMGRRDVHVKNIRLNKTHAIADLVLDGQMIQKRHYPLKRLFLSNYLK